MPPKTPMPHVASARPRAPLGWNCASIKVNSPAVMIKTQLRVAAVADALSVRAGVVIEHTMAPGLAEKLASLKQNIPARDLAALVSRASTQTTAADVLAMVEAI
jgi:hypothetical protein